MLRILSILLFALMFTACVSSSGDTATALKPKAVEKVSVFRPKNGECKMMPNGYLVCPKSPRK